MILPLTSSHTVRDQKPGLMQPQAHQEFRESFKGPNALQGRGKKDAPKRTSDIYYAGDTSGPATSSE